jgi:hypothetical protein
MTDDSDFLSPRVSFLALIHPEVPPTIHSPMAIAGHAGAGKPFLLLLLDHLRFFHNQPASLMPA